MNNKNLGKYQIEWMNIYGSIDLSKWRCELIHDSPDWYYIGDWDITEIEPRPSAKDGGYKKRLFNLKSNPYYYWPTHSRPVHSHG